MKIYAGNTHSMAISKDVFEVYTWGDGTKGQLGIKGDSTADPILVEDLIGKDIVKGACGYDFTGCITIEGKLYMFGSNVNFKLGFESSNLIEKYPKSVDTIVGVKKVRFISN
jgi:alpha-tubulin suppressor-like RCC1 family protein